MTPLTLALCALLAVPEVAQADSPASALASHLAALVAAWSHRP